MREPWEMTLDESYRYWHYNFNRLYYEAKAMPGFEEAEAAVYSLRDACILRQYGNHYFFADKLTPELRAKLEELEAFYKLANEYTHPNFHYDLVKEAIKEGKLVPLDVLIEFATCDVLMMLKKGFHNSLGKVRIVPKDELKREVDE